MACLLFSLPFAPNRLRHRLHPTKIIQSRLLCLLLLPFLFERSLKEIRASFACTHSVIITSHHKSLSLSLFALVVPRDRKTVNN